MDIWLLVALLLMSLFLVVLVVASNKNSSSLKGNLLISFAAVLLSSIIWFQMKQELPQPPSNDNENYTTTDFQDELQQSLKQDPNQSDLWFKLGGVYMQKGEFDAAFTCYDYAIRLDPQAPSGLYAAKATALYYLSSQAMSDDVNKLLEQSMDLDPNDRTALMLIATDHFISMRYQHAIDAWTQILDSNQKGIDRVSIIHSINQAKQMLR
ncbi:MULTISPECIES: tetratricopeptide repeat protein [unclassified Vibrio]|uniref:tetratricopeptide repeat protein n=1 Tax=unclassified Vibrio TaxID=2614977 RepID=UPI00159DEB04|nr:MULTISPECIES: tetratricopeptide repeat protein [unclassified Vibrio]NVN82930.1 tetratricopeptide repeat protein [Vibrio sp. Scap16]QLE91906.1 tetratricopeptide repeat protein [Vibrio sp. Scap24]